MTTNTAVIFLTRGYPNGETNSNNPPTEGVNKDGVALGTENSSAVLDSGSNNTTFNPNDYYPGAITFDAPKQTLYYVSNNESEDDGAQLFSISATAATNTPATLYTVLSQSDVDNGYTGEINDVVDNAATQTLYFTQVVLDGNNDPVPSESGIYSISESGGTATKLPIANIDYANVLAIDPAANLVFFTNSNGNNFNQGQATAVNQLDVANLTTGAVTTLLTEPYVQDAVYGTDGYGGAVLDGLAINTATDTLYYTTDNLTNTGEAGVYAASFTVTGSGSTASASLGTTRTLYSGTNSDNPSSISIDLQDGVFYVVGNPLVKDSGDAGYTATAEGVFEGSLTANNTTALTRVTPANETSGSEATGEVVWDAVADVAPALTAGASVTYAAGGSAIITDATLNTSSVSSPSYTGATVVIGSPATGDTLSATTSGTAITASYSAGTLTLSGTDTVAHYQQVLDSVTFSSTASVPTAGARTLTYSVTDGITTSTATSTVTVHDAPTVTAGATKSFETGGSPVLVDPSGAVTAPSSATLASATVRITGNFATGDTLATGTPGGLNSAYSAGVLTLTGTASAAIYQTAIDSITFSTSNISSTAARTLSYTVNDGTASSSTATSTVDVDFPPNVTAGAAASFTAGGSPVAVDPALSIADPSSSSMTGATVTIGAGFLAGDTLNFANQNSINGSYDASSGVLTLSGTDSLTNYQTALDSVTYSFSPANGDPTNGGADTSRTISITVTDSLGDRSAAASSTINIARPTPAIMGTQAGQMTTDQAAVMPFAGVTVSDSAGEQDSAAITLSAGGTPTDADGTLSGAGLTHTGTGTYTLAATDPGSLTTDLRALVFTPTANQVPPGDTVTTEFTLAVSDTGGGNATDDTTTVVTTALCFCKGTRIMTGGQAVAVEDLAIGDLVLTLEGTLEPIRWIGRRHYAGAFIAGRRLMLPVCVKAGALANGIPARDLFVSPGHGLFLGGQLVPAWRLINGVSIIQAEAVEEVRYFHIELERHAILFAEGTPAESFLDEDFHMQFHNAAEYPPRRPDAPPVTPYAPRLEDGFALQCLQRRIAARAGLHRRKQRPGALRGFIDKATPGHVCGWLQDETQPEEPVPLTILIAGHPILSVLANQYRGDLHAAGLGSGCHSFETVLDDPWPGPVEVVRATDGAVLADWSAMMLIEAELAA
jgi:hypothetical protein